MPNARCYHGICHEWLRQITQNLSRLRLEQNTSRIHFKSLSALARSFGISVLCVQSRLCIIILLARHFLQKKRNDFYLVFNCVWQELLQVLCQNRKWGKCLLGGSIFKGTFRARTASVYTLRILNKVDLCCTNGRE